MPNCFDCVYKYKKNRRFKITYHCILEPTNMDVSYFCRDKHRKERNRLCPFINKNTRYPGLDFNYFSMNSINSSSPNSVIKERGELNE